MAKGNPIFGAAVLKLTLRSRLAKDPGARELYEGTLKDLGVTDAEVELYIDAHRAELDAARAGGRDHGGTGRTSGSSGAGGAR